MSTFAWHSSPPNLHRKVISFGLVLLLVSLSLGSRCDPPVRGGMSTVTIDYNFRLDLPREVSGFDRTFTFYAGAPFQSFQFNLDLNGLPSGASIEVRSGDGTLVQTITGSGTQTSNSIPGNVGMLRVVIPTRTTGPNVTVRSLAAVRPSSYVAAPVVAPALANSVTAFPIAAGSPVETAFTADETNHFFSIQGLSASAVDIILFGPGRVRIADPTNGDWPARDDLAMEIVPHQEAGGTPGGFAFKRLTLNNRNSLFFAVTNQGTSPATGHTRFIVLPVTTLQKLSFPSTAPQDFSKAVTGIDHNPGAGTAGPFGGKLDCTNYAGVRGYLSLPPVCYDGHQGMDYPLLGGPLAQQIGVPVSAARPGIVLATDAAHADDCFWDPRTQAINCPDTSLPLNFVVLRHDDGLIAYYLHLKTESIGVVPGEPVVCGEKLGEAASAGDSSGPHLHFELRELSLRSNGLLRSFLLGEVRDNSQFVDPFQSNL